MGASEDPPDHSPMRPEPKPSEDQTTRDLESLFLTWEEREQRHRSRFEAKRASRRASRVSMKVSAASNLLTEDTALCEVREAGFKRQGSLSESDSLSCSSICFTFVCLEIALKKDSYLSPTFLKGF